MKFFENIKNNIDFFIRKKTKFSRKNFTVKQENIKLKTQREKELEEKYDFTLFSNGMTKTNYLENLYMIDILDKYFPKIQSEKLNVLDVGSKNWSYAKAEYIFFKKLTPSLNLKGIEIDAHRLYPNFYSRYEVAKFHIKDLKNTEYLAKDFLKYDEKFDVLIWCLPFIKEYPHLKWGLPLKHFCPEKMLWHAYFSLNTGGKMLIINQGEDEKNIQKKLLEVCAIPHQEIGEIISEIPCFEQKRYGFLITKKGADDRLN